MASPSSICVFGEVLFDVFPDGQALLGGAPFNVAWHLQAFGDNPLFISRVGCDTAGQHVRTAMQGWQMRLDGLQDDNRHPTGRVDVVLDNGEPGYRIAADCAYDFLDGTQVPPDMDYLNILYHGSLALRSKNSRGALAALKQNRNMAVFIDVNLRSPWWCRDEILALLDTARWAKLNDQELQLLSGCLANGEESAQQLVGRHGLEHLIVTCGAAGAYVCDAAGDVQRVSPQNSVRVVDTVGAGDAFAAAYLHGLIHHWPQGDTLDAAQMFAAKVVGLQGAISYERDFYQCSMRRWRASR